MTTFKAGDKVRVVRDLYSSVLHNGEIHTIDYVTSNYVYIDGLGWDYDRFELVIPKVKVGDRVRIDAPDMTTLHGQFGTVTSINEPDWPYRIIVGTIDGLYTREEFVEPEPKFKVGDRVQVTRQCAYGPKTWGKVGTVTEVQHDGEYPIRVRLDGATEAFLYAPNEIAPGRAKVVKTQKNAIQVQAHIEGGKYSVGRSADVSALFERFLARNGYELRGKVTTNVYEYTETTEV